MVIYFVLRSDKNLDFFSRTKPLECYFNIKVFLVLFCIGYCSGKENCIIDFLKTLSFCALFLSITNEKASYLLSKMSK